MKSQLCLISNKRKGEINYIYSICFPNQVILKSFATETLIKQKEYLLPLKVAMLH